MKLRKLLLIIIVSSYITSNASSLSNQKNEYNLQKIFIQNFDFTAILTVIPNKVTKKWTNITRIKNKEKIFNTILTTKVENIDTREGAPIETEYHWYDNTGTPIKYDDSNTIYEINPKIKYEPLPNNAKIGETGKFPELHSKEGKKIKTLWSLKSKNGKTIFNTLSKIYSKQNIVNEVIENDYIIDTNGKILDFDFNFYFGNKVAHLVNSKSKQIIYK